MDKFDPIRILGEGSFGKVYLMRDKVRRKFVCVKVIKIKNIPKKEREATKMEVDLLRRLHHPNIVRYIDSFLSKNNESLCIAMEYCDGGDLASQIKNAKRKLFSEDKVLHWFVQIALGLHYMHQNKVLHRDLKTQNVFLLGNGRLVLGDLGISKVLEGNMDFAQTCIGTPYYMSPEIFKNKPYSYKADVWALGCVLYEMTTLNHAFDANSLNGLAQKIIKGKYPAVHSKYSRYLRELIGQMLAPEPKQRPDLDQILRKPFIRKQVLSFFVEMASRPSNSVGEGTMIVRGALGGGAAGGNDQNTIELRHQLESLGMARDLAEALAPKAAPSDPMQAQKMAKEQALQLRREEEHRKMVEAALERLRLERENRAKERGAQAAARVNKPVHVPRSRPDYYGRNKPAVPRQEAPPSGLRQGAVREGGGIGRRNVGGPSAAERRLQEEKERIKALQDAEDRELAEQRAHQKRESEARAAAAAREAERAAREAAADAQRRERASERRSYLNAERERREEEKRELLKEKEKLDRIFEEKARSNSDRIQENRRKVEEDRLRQHGGPPEYSYQDNRGGRSEEKSELSAKDKVLQRKLEKQAREEQERVDALRRAAEENRRIGAQAQQQYHSQWHDAPPPRQEAEPRRGPRDRSPAIPEEKNSNGEGYHFEAEGRARVRDSNDVNVEEMTARLNDVAPAGRYSEMGRNDDFDIDDMSEDDLSDDVNLGEGEAEEEDEDMRQRENELQEELNLATVRVSELKQTLQNTKSFIEGHGGVPAVPSKRNVNARSVAPDPRLRAAIPDEDEEEDEDEDAYEYEEDEEYEEEEQELPSHSRMDSEGKSEVNDLTPRVSRPANIAIKPSPYQNLHDPPTPTGKLADRIRRLRDRCVDALGRSSFDRAYDFLIKYDEADVGNFYEGEAEDEKAEKMKSILGEGKVHYMPLIEQLIFMEATHC